MIRVILVLVSIGFFGVSSAYATEAAAASSGQSAQQATSTLPAGQAYIASVKAVDTAVGTCETAKTTAAGICDKMESPGMQAVLKGVNVLAKAYDSQKSAKENCAASTDTADFANTATKLAQGACQAKALACKATCTSAVTAAGASVTAANAYVAQAQENLQVKEQNYAGCTSYSFGYNCSAEQAAVTEAKKELAEANAAVTAAGAKQTATAPKPAECKVNLEAAVGMGVEALGYAMTKSDSEKCEEELAPEEAAGAAAGGAPPAGAPPPEDEIAELDAMCEKVENKSLEKCLNKTNSASSGLLGKGQQGASQMAGMGRLAGKGSNSGTGSNSDSATQDTTLDDGQTSEVAGFGSAGSTDSGKMGAFGKSSDGDTLGKAKNVKDNSGGFSALSGAFGGMFGGKKPDAAAIKEQAKLNAKRKLAAEEYQAQVSMASGKSNWDKIRDRYVDYGKNYGM